LECGEVESRLLPIYLMMRFFFEVLVLNANTSTIGKVGANCVQSAQRFKSVKAKKKKKTAKGPLL
jgi:hypothetical protein